MTVTTQRSAGAAVRPGRVVGLVVGALALGVACGGASEEVRAEVAPEAVRGAELPADDQGRCEVEGNDLEVSEYDTSGDDHPDVRRVYRRVGTPPRVRLILSCREVDLNADGIKDVVRYYNEEGRPLREEADRNFDGQLDSVTHFQAGRIVRREIDSNGNGRIDTKVFYENGRVARIERDLAGRSGERAWTPDRWEYVRDGRVVRMGTDVDGDASHGVDRWDRDAQWQAEHPPEAAEDDGGEDEPAEADATFGDEAAPDA